MAHLHISDSTNYTDGKLSVFSMPIAAALTEDHSTKNAAKTLMFNLHSAHYAASNVFSSSHSFECSDTMITLLSLVHNESSMGPTMVHDHATHASPVMTDSLPLVKVEDDDDLDESSSCRSSDSNSVFLSKLTILKAISMVMSPVPIIIVPKATSVSGTATLYMFEPFVGPFNDFSAKPDQPLNTVRPDIMRHLDPIDSPVLLHSSMAANYCNRPFHSSQRPTAFIGPVLKFVASLRGQEDVHAVKTTYTYMYICYETEGTHLPSITHPTTMDHRDKPIEERRAPDKLMYGKVHSYRQPRKRQKLRPTISSNFFREPSVSSLNFVGI